LRLSGRWLGLGVGILRRLVCAELGEQPGFRERGSHGVVDPLVRLADRILGAVVAVATVATLTALRPILEAARLAHRRCGGRGRRTILRLLETEAQPMTLGVKADDLELEDLALLDDVARMAGGLVGELADVAQELQAFLDAVECAEVV